MPDLSLLESGEFSFIGTGAAAAQTDYDSTVIDMAGYDGVLFVTAFGAIAATATPKVTIHDSDTNAVGTAISATAQTIGATDDDKLVIHDLLRPKKRYLAVRVVRDLVAADSTVDAILAIRYRARSEKVTQDSADVSSSAAYVGAGN